MIGCTSSFLVAVRGCTYDDTAGCMRNAAGAPVYPYVASSRDPSWTGQWALGTTGLSCSRDTYNKLYGATAVTSPTYLDGCFIATSGVMYQLKVNAGAATPGDPPPPPPPP